MYSIGEIVLYGSNGVCEITEITTKKIGKDSIEYYVLKPVCSDSSTLFVPTQNEMLVSRMRAVLSSDEIKDILSQKTASLRKPIMKYGLTIKPKDVKKSRRLFRAAIV